MRLYVAPEYARLISQHVIRELPNEACGMLLGINNEVKQIVWLANVEIDPSRAYRIDEQSLVRTFFEARKRSLDVVGFYHSHPDGDPIPSQTDIQQAAYPDTPYLIVGMRSGEPRLAAWSIQYQQVQPVEIVLASKPAVEVSDDPFSGAHRLAIIVSTIIAVIFMIIISLILLPPAPIVLPP